MKQAERTPQLGVRRVRTLFGMQVSRQSDPFYRRLCIVNWHTRPGASQGTGA